MGRGFPFMSRPEFQPDAATPPQVRRGQAAFEQSPPDTTRETAFAQLKDEF
jgi:hypothetical protein